MTLIGLAPVRTSLVTTKGRKLLRLVSHRWLFVSQSENTKFKNNLIASPPLHSICQRTHWYLRFA